MKKKIYNIHKINFNNVNPTRNPKNITISYNNSLNALGKSKNNYLPYKKNNLTNQNYENYLCGNNINQNIPQIQFYFLFEEMNMMKNQIINLQTQVLIFQNKLNSMEKYYQNKIYFFQNKLYNIDKDYNNKKKN